MASPFFQNPSFSGSFSGVPNPKANLFGSHSQSMRVMHADGFAQPALPQRQTIQMMPPNQNMGSSQSAVPSPFLAAQVPTYATPMLSPQQVGSMQIPIHEASPMMRPASLPIHMIQPSEGYFISGSPAMATPQIIMDSPPNLPMQGSAWTVLEQGPMDGGAWTVMEAPPPPLPLIPLTPSEGAFPLRRPPVAGTPGIPKGSVSVSELRDIFNTLDINHDGRITHAEFIKGLKANPKIASTLNLPQSVARSQENRDAYTREFNQMDVDGDHQLTFDEMLRHYAPWAVAPMGSPDAPKLIGGATPSPESTRSEPKRVVKQEQPAAVRKAAPPTLSTSDLRSRPETAVRTPMSMATVDSPGSYAPAVSHASVPTRAAPPVASAGPPTPLGDTFNGYPVEHVSSPPRPQTVGSLRAASPPRQVDSSRSVSMQLATYSEALPADGNQEYDRRPGSVKSPASMNGSMRVVSGPQRIQADREAVMTTPRESRVPQRERASTGSAPRGPSAYEQRQSVLRNSGFSRGRFKTEGLLHGYDGSSSQWKKRKFVLEGGALSYKQEESAGGGEYGAAQSIPIYSSATLEVLRESHFNKPNCFILRNKDDGDVYLLSANTPEERNAWVVALEDAGVGLITKETENFLNFSLPCIFGNPF